MPFQIRACVRTQVDYFPLVTRQRFDRVSAWIFSIVFQGDSFVDLYDSLVENVRTLDGEVKDLWAGLVAYL